MLRCTIQLFTHLIFSVKCLSRELQLHARQLSTRVYWMLCGLTICNSLLWAEFGRVFDLQQWVESW